MDFVKVYDLTRLTRGAAAERRVVVSGFEIQMRHMILAGAALFLGIVTTIVLWPLANSAGLISILAWFGALFWLIEVRTARGLQLSNWKSLKNKATDQSGKFFICGEEYNPLESSIHVVARRAVDIEPAEPSSVDLVPITGKERSTTPKAVQTAMSSWGTGERRTQ